MNLKQYYRSLPVPEREAFCERAGTTRKYMEIHLMLGDRMPRKDMMVRLADASQGEISYADVVDYFHHDEIDAH